MARGGCFFDVYVSCPGAKHKIAETAEPMTEEEKCSTWWHQTACGGGAMGDYCCYGAIAILDAGMRSADSGKMELVNNLHWQIG